MRWLIIEDSIESRRGHWFEYLENFCRDLPTLGDEVTVLASRLAERFIQTRLGAIPCLPASAFAKMSDGAPAWRRYLRIPLHAWETFWAVRGYLRVASKPDVIFVPTVTVHHLLAWVLLVKLSLKHGNTPVLLFFPGLPILKRDNAQTLDGSPTGKLMGLLLYWLGKEIHAGKVILGVETHAMKHTAEKVFDLPFTYFPHPVSPTNINRPDNSLTMACYGPARHEKGSDLLAAAVQKYLERFPAGQARFVLQWLEDFTTASGAVARPPATLPRMEIVTRFFEDGEYAQRLGSTQVMLLPYRFSSYGLRVSRVVIEAMVNGMPVVTTRGTTMAQQAEEFGAAKLCEDEDVESLVVAIETMERNYESLATKARQRQASAQEHFSVEHFRKLMLTEVLGVPTQTSLGERNQ
jgi:glycosyltransferase involved in cell wall biosynthesis